MPVYDYKCIECGASKDAFRSIADRENAPECDCGGKMQKMITPTQVGLVMGGYAMPGYKCPVSGEYVTSRKQRREIMARHNLVERG